MKLFLYFNRRCSFKPDSSEGGAGADRLKGHAVLSWESGHLPIPASMAGSTGSERLRGQRAGRGNPQFFGGGNF